MPAGGRTERAFLIGIILNLLYSGGEATAGFLTSSMGLISDAGHNLADVATLAIGLIAIRVSRRPATERFTYGFRKATVQASMFNSILLWVAVAFILWESVDKLIHPVAVPGGVIAWVAAGGIAVNGFTAWILFRSGRGDLNVRSAAVHMLTDLLGSSGVVVAGVVIACTGWHWVDPVAGILVGLGIAHISWELTVESMRLNLDGVPQGVDLRKIKEDVEAVPGVSDFHHIHVWAMSTTDVALTAHMVIADPASLDQTLARVKKVLAESGITHSTIEPELVPQPGDEDYKLPSAREGDTGL